MREREDLVLTLVDLSDHKIKVLKSIHVGVCRPSVLALLEKLYFDRALGGLGP